MSHNATDHSVSFINMVGLEECPTGSKSDHDDPIDLIVS